jgi:hypothetical protein
MTRPLCLDVCICNAQNPCTCKCNVIAGSELKIASQEMLRLVGNSSFLVALAAAEQYSV